MGKVSKKCGGLYTIEGELSYARERHYFGKILSENAKS